MDKKQYVLDTIKNVNANKNCTREEISTTLSYHRELTENGIFLSSEIESRQIGGLLSAALAKVSKYSQQIHS